MRQFENADSKLNQHAIKEPRPSCSNIRLAKWNKTERNTPGVPGLVVDNQALATTKTERPFHFVFDDPAEYSGVVRGGAPGHGVKSSIFTNDESAISVDWLDGTTVASRS